MTKRKANPELGIVVPCLDEEEVLPALFAELDNLSGAMPGPVYFLFIDDGSSDRTLEILTARCDTDSRYACVSLSRNFGHQAAVSAGLRQVRGDIVAVLDADLQDPPEVIPGFIEKWREGYDVVFGIRTDRKESVLLRSAYAVFYRILKKIARVDLPLDAGDFALMDRRVVDQMNRMPEHNRFIRGMRGWVGFKQTGVPYERQARESGRSKYTFQKLMKLALDGLFSFSSVPLRLASWLGALAAFLGFGYLLYSLVARWSGAPIPEGWTSTVVIVLFLGGIQLMMLGILGDYVGRIFDEVKNRPQFIQKEALGWVADRRPEDDSVDAE